MGFGLLCVAENGFTAKDEGGWWVLQWVLFVWGYWMSVVGFDIGNENCVITVAKQGGIVVLLNDESKHETPPMVSFGGKQRFMGLVGAASATMK